MKLQILGLTSLLGLMASSICAENISSSKEKACSFYYPAVTAQVTNDYHQDLLVGSLEKEYRTPYMFNRFNDQYKNIINFTVPSKQSRNGNLTVMSDGYHFSTIIHFISTHGKIDQSFESITIDMKKDTRTCKITSVTCSSRWHKSTCKVSIESPGGNAQSARVFAKIKVLKK